MRLTWMAMALSALVAVALATSGAIGWPGGTATTVGAFEIAQSVPCPSDRCPR